PRRGPTAPTHVAGERAPGTPDDVTETGRCPADRAHPELPPAVRQVFAGHQKVLLEERPQRRGADERDQRGIEADAVIDGPQPPAGREQRRHGQVAGVPRVGERAESVERVATEAADDVENRTQQWLDGLCVEWWRGFGQDRHATLPPMRARTGVPVERRDLDGS